MTRSTLRPSPLAVLLLAAALLFGATACGSDGELDSVGPTSTDGPVDTGAADPSDVGANGSSDPVDESGETADPGGACDLLTESDAGDALGEPVEPGEDNGTWECRWATENDLKVASLAISEPDLDDWRSGLENEGWEPTDIGDEGYRGVGGFHTVEFLVGEAVYEINVIYSTSGDAEAALDELANAVADRL